MRLPTTLRLALLAACATLTLGAQAVPVAFLAGTLAQTSDGINVDFEQQMASTSTRTNTPNAGSIESVSATANLATGTLRQKTENVAVNSSAGQITYGSSFIGDSFRHYSNVDPFNWTSGSTAQFRIHVDGTESLVPGPGDYFNLSIIALVIYAPGTLQSDAPFCNTSTQNNVLHAFFWSIGPNPRPAPCGGTFMGNFSGSVDTDLVASFQPAGDFDWVFGLKLGGIFNLVPENSTGSGAWINDFANTVTLTYEAPVGADVRSSSGVFPGTSALAVPEPGSLALLGLGLVAITAVRRRRA